MMKLNIGQTVVEPAEKSYFFGPGYEDLRDIIKGAWANNADTIDDLKFDRDDALDDVGFFRWVKIVFYIFAILAMRIFGAIFFLLISCIHAAALMAFMAVMYCFFGVVWGIDRLILWRRKVSHVCLRCRRNYLIPMYKCSCGREHKKLTPGKYGILTRTCECGNKLPTSGLKRVNGLKRKDLPAFCPYCGAEDKQGESMQLVIPVGGGRSSGKSVFINAFVYDFMENVADKNGLDVEPYDDDMCAQYQRIKDIYQKGDKEHDKAKSSEENFSFWIRHKKLGVPRLMHIMNIDGKSFVEGTEEYTPEQYKYCKGTVLIIDPFSIPQFRNEIIDELNSADKDGISPDFITDVLNSFVLKLKSILLLKSSQNINIPVAIAIAKIDSGGLEEKIGETAIERKMNEEPETYDDYYDTMDALCREFLKNYGEDAFLTMVDNELANVRLFSFSALGHSLGTESYQPQGIMPIMEWIIAQGDSKLSGLWQNEED